MAKRARRLEEIQITWEIRAARMGEPQWMATVYRKLARAMRAGELSTEEIEFIAGRLEAVADAVPSEGIKKDDKASRTRVCHALLLLRGRAGKTSAHESETLAFERAVAMRDLIDRGMSPTCAADQLAGELEQAIHARPFLEAWAKYAPCFGEAGEPLDGGEDPRL